MNKNKVLLNHTRGLAQSNQNQFYRTSPSLLPRRHRSQKRIEQCFSSTIQVDDRAVPAFLHAGYLLKPLSSPVVKTLIRFFSLPSLRRPWFFQSSATRAMSSASGQRVFQLKVDPLTGDSEWIVIDENEHEFAGCPDNGGLLALTSYLDMLNDSRRNRAFCLAIEKTVTKPCRVIDIGAGTGLLSMMAARTMSARYGDHHEGMVTACESYLPMVKLMRKVLNANRMGKHIKIVNKRSDELEVGIDIASRADVLVSEILDSELLGEGLIPTLQHAHDKLLVKNPLTVPYRATIFCQLVESAYLWKLQDLNENDAERTNGIRLTTPGLGTLFSVRPQQYAMHCDPIENEIRLLSEPIKIFEFDFGKRPESHGELKVLIGAINDGCIHAVISWWVLQLDCEGSIFYSTAPKWIKSDTDQTAREWCDHWKQFVWLVPGKGVSVFRGERVLLHAVHTDVSVSYNLKTGSTASTISNDFLNEDPRLTLPPERIGIYGDDKWRFPVVESLYRALQERFQPVCVVADDSAFLTLAILHLSETAHVISLFPGLREQGSRLLESFTKSNDKNHVEVSQKGNACLSSIDTNQKKVDLVIGEPYYHGHHGGLPWQNLRFWKERTKLDSILSKHAVIMPCKGILRASAMYLPDLWRSRCCLSKIEGFDHAVANTMLGACGDLPAGKASPVLPYFLWQCGETKQLSKVFKIMEFDFREAISPCSAKVQVEFTEHGICHGFVLWIDWVMDMDDSLVVSTGPYTRHWKQGVKLLKSPVEIGSHGSGAGRSTAVIEASFDPWSQGILTISPYF